MENKFAFILCSNQELYLQECIYYLSKLHIPEGYEIELLSINDARSIAGGYNEGQRTSNARYKIYMHHDVFILNRNFLYDILKIFNSDSNIGMIGMVGALQMPPDGVMWHGYRTGALYETAYKKEEYSTYQFQPEDGIHTVEAIDGLMMITSVDLPWREDILDGWDFYDVSHSLEMRRKGYRVVVPEQHNPWCFHDDGILSLQNYDYYRKICMKEYSEYLGEGVGKTV